MLRRRLSRTRHYTILVGTTAFGLVLAVPSVALAHGGGGISVSCTDDPTACTLGAQAPGSQTVGTGTASSRHGNADGHGTSPQTAAQPSGHYGGLPPMVCSDEPFVPSPADLASLGLHQPPGPGHWVLQTCMTTMGAYLILPVPQWVPAGAAAPPDPRVLAAQAVSKLTMPRPHMESSPGAGVPQTVELPTWVWLPKSQWEPLSATASVPGESVTAIATPLSVTWLWGDGTSTVCHGPGTPYVKGVSDPASASPDCGHTYHQTSAAAPDQQFPVTATLTWAVSWSGGGQSGTFPDLTTTASAHWTVRQIESLIINQ